MDTSDGENSSGKQRTRSLRRQKRIRDYSKNEDASKNFLSNFNDSLKDRSQVREREIRLLGVRTN